MAMKWTLSYSSTPAAALMQRTPGTFGFLPKTTWCSPLPEGLTSVKVLRSRTWASASGVTSPVTGSWHLS
jgi:hypothetical protein